MSRRDAFLRARAAVMAAADGRLGEARSELEAALHTYIAAEDAEGALACLHQLAMVAVADDRDEDAHGILDSLGEQLEGAGVDVGRSIGWFERSKVELVRRRPQAALVLLDEAIAALPPGARPALHGRLLRERGFVLLACERPEEAVVELVEAAVELADDPVELGETYARLGAAEAALGRSADALQALELARSVFEEAPGGAGPRKEPLDGWIDHLTQAVHDPAPSSG